MNVVSEEEGGRRAGSARIARGRRKRGRERKKGGMSSNVWVGGGDVSESASTPTAEWEKGNERWRRAEREDGE